MLNRLDMYRYCYVHLAYIAGSCLPIIYIFLVRCVALKQSLANAHTTTKSTILEFHVKRNRYEQMRLVLLGSDQKDLYVSTVSRNVVGPFQLLCELRLFCNKSTELVIQTTQVIMRTISKMICYSEKAYMNRSIIGSFKEYHGCKRCIYNILCTVALQAQLQYS